MQLHQYERVEQGEKRESSGYMVRWLGAESSTLVVTGSGISWRDRQRPLEVEGRGEWRTGTSRG